MGVHVDGDDGGGRGHLAQQNAVRADDARGLYCVAALITMVSVGQGANEAVRKEIARLGTNLVVILPGAATSGGARGGSGSASTLTVTDAQAIRREATAVGEVSYLIRQSGQVRFANQNWTTGIQGVSAITPR